ncbi:MAG: hypothetical protein ACLVBP_16670 [Ruminococcus sp.]
MEKKRYAVGLMEAGQGSMSGADRKDRRDSWLNEYGLYSGCDLRESNM